MKREMARKSIHLAMLVIPVASTLLDRPVLLRLIGLLLLVALAVEVARKLWPAVNGLFRRLVGGMLRDAEVSEVTGATHLLMASFLSFWLFELWIAQVAVLFVIISDGLAALLGKWMGRHRCCGNKTWEGTAVFLVSAVIIVVLHPQCPLPVGLVGVVAALGADLFGTRWDDNLTIPLASGLVMQLVSWASV